ncbi:unnamed protein product [Cunninghamella blakesleeana]
MRSDTSLNNHNNSKSSSSSDPWDFDLLSSSLNNSNQITETTTTTTASTNSIDPFDMDSLLTNTNQENIQNTPSKNSNYEHLVTNNNNENSNDDDDDSNPLGILAQPVNDIVNKDSPKISDNKIEPSQIQEEEAVEPIIYDDSLLAQLVEMGFGIEESKIALEASGNIDLQSAIDIIVQQTEAMRQQQEQSQLKKEKRRNDNNNDNHNDTDRVASPTSTISSVTNSELSFQQHKERIVNQASELGGFLYKNASLFVKSGKQKISKAMEDWQEQQGQQGQQQPRQNKPKWMTDHDSIDNINDKNDSHLEKYVDSDDDDDNNNSNINDENSIKMMENERRQMEALRQRQLQQLQKQKQQRQKTSKSLFDDDDDFEYISPSRRRHTPPPSKPQQQTQPSIQNQTSEPIPKKPIVEVSSSILTVASQDREHGNKLYKLGQYGEAEISYTKGLDSLPKGHYHIILFSNNRAMTRLKTGDYKTCIQDCEVSIQLSKEIITHYNGKVHCQGIDINGKDQLIKALHRKAEALEHLESYEMALDTYQALVQWEGVGNVKVNHGLARCRKIVNGSSPSSPSSSNANRINNNNKPSTPKPSSTSINSPSVNDSKAVAAMRAQAAQQEKDDAERLAKTDQVNDRLAQWKQGKELNLRALLATLDTLLWDEAQWKPIQMSDLIQPKRCKIQYLKAIGKVHPDKLPSTVTVEQKMIASGIFSTLNEAWDEFKNQNNL